jgi:hypothetical protein
MILQENNLLEWKKALDKKMKDRYDIDDYSGCLRDSEWLEEYIGYSEEQAIEDETDNWD